MLRAMVGDFTVQARPGAVARPGSGLRLAAAVLLVLAAGLVIGGSFGAFTVYTSDYVSSSSPPSPTTVTQTGWRVEVTPQQDRDYSSQPFDGALLMAAAVLALAAVAVLVTSGRRPGGRVWGRSAGVGAAALLVGVLTELWLGLLSQYVSITKQVSDQDRDTGLRIDFGYGAGAWLLLGALLCALVAALVLLLSARSDRPAIVGPPPTAPYVPPGFHPAGHRDRP